MRSNNSATPNTQATNQSMMRRVSGIISKVSKKAANWLTLGVTGKQWLASLMICTMLSSIFALPVRAAIETNAYQAALAVESNPNHFEPVNEPVPFWREIWMDLNAKTEAWLTPMRAVNAAYKDADDKDSISTDKPKISKPSSKEMLERRVKTLDIRIDKKKKITVGQTFLLVAIAQDVDGKTIDGFIPNWTSSNPDILKINEDGQAVALKAGTVSLKAGAAAAEREVTVKVEVKENTSKEKVSKNASSSLALKAANIAFDVTPEQADRPILDNSELPVLVSPSNNLGSPPGQTEPISSIRAAATKTRDRAGIGNFSFDLPVASLPGRGISASIGLSYNSQMWTRTGSLSNYQYTYNVDGNWMGPGFQIGYGYLDAYFNGGNLPYQHILTDTNGTRHQFDLTSAPAGHAVYDSSDGSFMKSDGIYDINGAISSITVTYADGTKVLYGAANSQNRRFPVRITDIQGNYISINYLTGDQVGKIASVTDTLGRNIVFHYDTSSEQNLISVTVPGYNNSMPRQTIRFYYESLTLQTQNSLTQNRFTGTITAPTAVTVLKYIYYPGTNIGYRYDYSAAYGMIYKITRLEGMQVTSNDADTPGAVVTTSGAYLESATTHYDYPRSDVNLTAAALTDVPKYYNRADDWIGRDASAAAPNTNYLQTENIDSNTHVGTRTMTVTSPNGSINASISIVDPGVWDDGLTKETSVTSSGRSIPWVKTTIEWDPSTATSTGRRNPHVSKIIDTNEVGQAKATTFTYDDYDNPLTVREYDFAPSGQATTELRRTETAYVTSGNWIANQLVHLPLSVKRIVNNTVVSRTDYEYDQNALTDRANIIQHDSTYNSNNTQSNARGNVTKTTTFINPSGDAVNPTDMNDSVTTINYDIAGNPVQATLNCCNLKTWVYDSANYAYAFPTSETKGTDVQLTTGATYDFNTGLMRTAIDENNQVTTYDYEADTLRASKVTYSNGGYVQTEYSDKLITTTSQLSPSFVRQTTLLDTNKTVQSYSYFDGHGAILRRAAQTPDGWDILVKVYDPIGRPIKSYNPFYGTTPTDIIPTNVKWTEVTVYDSLDRTTQVKLQDNTLVNSYYIEAAVTYTDPTNQTKQGTATRGKDQVDKERRQIIDALGRVIRIDEPDVVSNLLGSVIAPNQPTYYSYDGNDNLSKVIQSGGTTTQERRFKYDALSRMTHEKQIEAVATLDDTGTAGVADPNKWTKVSKYNAHGDLSDDYDARGVHTHIDYDGLNRIWKINFSDDTPKVTYTYDQSRTGFYNKGALTRIETAQNTTNPRANTPDTATEFDYDKMGRVRQQRQTIDTQTYNLGYSYNLAGQLTSESYPSGKVVSIGYDANGRLANLADQSRTYISGLQYQGKGTSLSSMNLGNGTIQTMTMNDRLQMISQSLNKGTNVLQKYDYGYGQIDASGNLDTIKNNGQLAKIDSTIGAVQQWTQKFSYDSIGRLSEAKEYRGDNASLSYKQKFDYDRFGNLYRKNTSNPTAGQQNPLTYTPIEDTDISKTTNRFTTGTAYDNAGNVTQDTKFRSLNVSYDANGRVYKTSNTDNTNPANSVYDAVGNRVATQVDGVWSFFVYDIGGKLVSEYGGLAAMDEGGVKYVMQDWQGSTRAILSNSGFVQSRIDYTAFGEEIQSEVGLRTIAQGFVANSNFSQKYGLTERDKATGLDHTLFRKNENRAGRWTSPDPYNGSMSTDNPQSFNRYAYVGNDPINFVDPSGLDELGSAVAEAQDLLQFKPCANAVSKTGNPSKTLGQIYNDGKIHVTEKVPEISFNKSTQKFVTYGGVPYGNREAVTQTLLFKSANGKIISTPNAIYIDKNGAFFQHLPSGALYTVYPGQKSEVGLSDSDHRASALIHELMHWFGNSVGKNHDKAFNLSIYIRCFLINPRWTNRDAQPVDTTPGGIGTEISPHPVIGYNGGGIPGWRFSMQEFDDWLYSIPIGDDGFSVDVRYVQ